MRQIELTQGQVALVDDEDHEELNQYKWHAAKIRNSCYARRHFRGSEGKKGIKAMHHEIMGIPPEGFMMDHINGLGTDNRKENLRFVTRRQNAQNRVFWESTSQYPGVSWYAPYTKWMARIQINYKQKNLGYFIDEKEAFNAYKQAVEALGETVI